MASSPSVQSIRVTKPQNQGFFQDILNCFRSVHLAIVLLSLLAIGTLIGVVMPQEGMVEVAAIKAQYGTNYQFYNTLGFFNVYSSFWFITLQVLFFFNLLIGSFQWLKPATLAAIQKKTLPAELIAQKPEAHSLPHLLEGEKAELLKRVEKTLKKFHYGVYTDENGNIYASKGNITRLGPCVAHLGILLCLIAGLYSCFYGFKAVRAAVPGETFRTEDANTFKTNVPSSIWLGEIPKWKIRVNDFNAEFYPQNPSVAKQYASEVDILSPDGKQILKSQSVSVNHPMLYDNVALYQASYSPTGRFLLKVNGKSTVVSVNNQYNNRPISITPLPDKSALIMFPFFAGQDQGVSKNFSVFFIRKPGEKPLEGQMPENVRLAQGETGQLKGTSISYIKPEMSTGLQIKKAPEVPLMYLSYIIIGMGTLLCFFSQRRIWLSLKEVAANRYELVMQPVTNKARLSFRKELVRLQSELSQ